MLSLRLSISSNGAVKLQIVCSCIKVELFSGFFEADASLQTKHNDEQYDYQLESNKETIIHT